MNAQPPHSEFEPSRTETAKAAMRQRLSTMPPGSLRKILMIGGVALVAIIGSIAWLMGGRYVETDNAYIRAPKLIVSSKVSGTVTEVRVREGQTVKKGDVLFALDPLAFRIAVDNAKAQLAQAALNIESMKQDYLRMKSDMEAQQSQMKLAQATFDRAAALKKTGATTVAAYDQARFALNAAQSQQQSLSEQAKVLLAKLGGRPDMPATEHPSYLQAKAMLDEAQRQLDLTTVAAPFDGIVTQVDHLQPGQFLAAATAGLSGTGAVALVGSEDLWVEANFKETDLTHVRTGNPATVTIDAFPGTKITGRVESISPASGAEFSIIPAQNASGNWVKVVQRIPVRIAIERKPGTPALRAGMSVGTTIDTGRRRTLADLW